MKTLIADDDVTTRRMLRAALTHWGHPVCEASNGEEAWAQLTGPEPAELAIVDWMMPDLSGPDLCRRLKASRLEPMPYVILLTSKTQLQDVVSALDAGADDFITKPYKVEELRARLAAGGRVVALQRQLLDLNQQLEQRVQDRTEQIQDLLRQKQELVTQLGHDLRTPLTPLVALLPGLVRGEKEMDRRDALQMCLDQVQLLRRLAERVFALSQLDSPRTPVTLGPVLLADIAEASIHPMLSARGDFDRLGMEIPMDLQVSADPKWLGHVFEDLVDNACRYSEPGTPIHVSATRAGDKVVVRISDQGRGLRAEDLERVFEPFFTGDAARHDRRANGIGLAFCRRILDRHGGRIWAESEGPGKGAAFHFTLASADEHPSAPRRPEPCCTDHE